MSIERDAQRWHDALPFVFVRIHAFDRRTGKSVLMAEYDRQYAKWCSALNEATGRRHGVRFL